MNVKSLAIGLLMLMAALFVSVNAIEITTSDSNLYISSTQASVYAYVKNTASETRQLYLSVDGRSLNAQIEPYATSVRQGSTGGAYINIVAPDCFRGSELVTIYAQLCSSSTCESASKKVTVNVEPARQCATYIEGFAPTTQFISGTSCGSNGCFNVDSIAPKRSSLISTAYFDATSYDLRISGADSCPDVKRGEPARIKITLSNRGAAGNFDLRVISDSDISAFPSKDYVALSRSSADYVYVDIVPDKDLSEGRHFVTLQALHLDELVAEKDLCINLEDEFSTSFTSPTSADATTANDLTIQLSLKNDGTTVQHYAISAFNSDLGEKLIVFPEKVTLQPGALKFIDVTLKTTALVSGTYKLDFVALSEDSEEFAEMLVTVKSIAKPVEKSVALDATSTQKENKLLIQTVIQNDGNTLMDGLTLEILGLPEKWEVSDIPEFKVNPNSQKTIKFEITMNSDELANPKIVVLQNGKTLSTQTLPQVSGKTGGFTGLFNLSSGNWLIGIVIVLGVLAFFMIGRREDSEGNKLESIRYEIGDGDSQGSSGSHR